MTALMPPTRHLARLVIAMAVAAGTVIPANAGITFTTYTTANGLGTDDVRGIYASGGSMYAATSGGVSVSAVPEPSTYVLTLAGLACGGWHLRRRRRA